MHTVERRGIGIGGCATLVLLLLVVLVVVVGLWRNWFEVASRNTPEKTDITLRVHKEALKSDFQGARDEAEKIAEPAEVAAELESMEGTVTQVSASEVTIQTQEREHVFLIDEVTSFRVGSEEATRQSVREGAPVRVTFQEKDARKRAARVTVLDRPE